MALVGKRSEQQSRVYAAQIGVGAAWPRFDSIDSIQRYVDSLTSTEWWYQRYPTVPRVEVQKTRSTKVSYGTYDCENNCGLVAISKTMMNARTVLHEVAHTISPNAGHGPVWVRNFLTIVYFALGSNAYMELYDAFVNGNVDIG